MRFSSRQIPSELSEQKTTPVSLQNTHNSELFPRDKGRHFAISIE